MTVFVDNSLHSHYSKSADSVARVHWATTPSVNSAFEREFVVLFSGFLHVLGLPKSVGSIYGLLFASPEPLCFADIVEKLGASKGSISRGLAFLRQCRATKNVEMVDDRREFFEPELGLRGLASGLILEKFSHWSKRPREQSRA